MDGISHLEDQWPMDVGFVVDDGVCMVEDDLVMFRSELNESLGSEP